MKISKKLVITAVALTLSINNFVMAKTAPVKAASVPACFNVAVVDVQKVVENSPQINALKTDRKNKVEDLAKFVEKARTDVAKETDDNKKKALEDSYNKELNVRKDNIDKDYVKKLSTIDKDITTLIKTKAKEGKYDLILTKNSVINGGTDITSEIIKDLK